jgi:hypothetical protein
MADEVTTVGIPTDNGEDPPRIETDSRAEDAPWGLKDDGTPYKRDPAIYARRDGKRRPTAPKASKTKTKRSPYREHVLGIVQIVGLPLAAAGTRDERFLADLVALNATAEPIADAMDSLAQSNETVAKALDKLGEVGPYGLLIGAVAPLILQIAANHSLVPAGTLGTVTHEVLLEAARDGQVPGSEGMAA